MGNTGGGLERPADQFVDGYTEVRERSLMAALRGLEPERAVVVD